MNKKYKVLESLLVGICDMTAQSWYKDHALNNNRAEYLHIEFSSDYGGYRLVKVNVKTGGHSSSFINMSDVSPRLSYKEFYNYLRGVYAGLYEKKLLRSETIVNNYERVFMVTYSYGKSFFCNISDLNRLVIDNDLKPGYFTIYHFYNNKLKKVSKKDLKRFFAGNQIEMLFHY